MSPNIDQHEKCLEIPQISWWNTKTGGCPYPVTIISFDRRWEVLNCIQALEVNTFAKVSCHARNSWMIWKWWKENKSFSLLNSRCVMHHKLLPTQTSLCKWSLIRINTRDTCVHHSLYQLILSAHIHFITITTSLSLNHFKLIKIQPELSLDWTWIFVVTVVLAGGSSSSSSLRARCIWVTDRHRFKHGKYDNHQETVDTC